MKKLPMLQILSSAKEPTFASGEQRGEKNRRYVVYFDHEGGMACCNFVAHSNFRLCIICGNCCLQFMAHDDGTYTCSACGKFPKELLQQ